MDDPYPEWLESFREYWRASQMHQTDQDQETDTKIHEELQSMQPEDRNGPEEGQMAGARP